MPSPRDATLHEFAAYYNADELPMDLLLQAEDSGERLVHILGPEGAAEAATMLRAAAGDPTDPLLAEISTSTQFDWVGDAWQDFQQLAGRIAGKIDELT